MSTKSAKTIPFVNNKGEIIQLKASLTIKQLVKLGVRDIRFIRKDEPIPDGYYANLNEPIATSPAQPKA